MIELRLPAIEKFCRDCKGCCRYGEQESVWSPLFMFEEIVEVTGKNIVPCSLFSGSGGRSGKAARIRLVERAGHFLCPCLDPESNACKIYAFRPLDCRLYPFLLARRDHKAYLALDKKCPYAVSLLKEGLAPKTKQTLVDFLESELFLKQAQNNPEIVQEYACDTEFLAVLPRLSLICHGTSASHLKR
jgi:Fe-S-cluster containining protein